ncbi:MAG: PQQ-dependent sugar dehydrogenase [Pseudomonadales bacterium]|nr:PQQ-dependent sugar dehydrogenase [Pseudomonadales bacterium]
MKVERMMNTGRQATSRLLILLSALISMPVPAQNFSAAPPLPEFPLFYQSTEYNIRVDKLTDGLANPWSMAFLPNGDMLVTERAGRLRRIHDGVLDPRPIPGVPEVKITVLGGLLDVLLHPDFANNHLLYLSYAKAHEDGRRSSTALARARFDGEGLLDLEEIFVAESWSASPTNFGGRMTFGADGMLYLTIGERQEQDRAQDGRDHGGKILRLRDDGTVPDDNPFIGHADMLPEIYALGIRSPQGLVLHPTSGELWENEHGPLGGDEMNIIRAGGNYGWPLATHGLDYDGSTISELTARADLQAPFMIWIPSIAISGLSFYTGGAFPLWQGNAFVGAMVMGRTPMTGHIQRITFSDEGVALAREPILLSLHQRIRDVRPGPDGLLYVLTDHNPGALLRISPAD